MDGADRHRQAADPLGELVWLEVAERQPDVGRTRALGHHRPARQEGHAMANRLVVEVALVEVVAEGQPQVPAASRSRDGRDRFEVALDRGEENVVALAVERDRPLHLGLVAAVGQEARGHELGEGGAVDVVVSLLADDALEHRAARGEPARAQSGADGLGERRHVDDVAREHRSERRCSRAV